jgi:hypothetical protein
VEADFAIELGADDEVLEMPWAAPDGSLRYHDLKRYPELLREIQEVHRAPELGDFLVAANSRSGILESAKCDVWSSDQMNPEEEIFVSKIKFGCYVDLLFSQEPSRLSFVQHENAVRRLTKILQEAPRVPAAAEFLVRRCYYHREQQVSEGFYITLYLFGYGADENQARRQWGVGLKLAERAIRQWSEP